MLDYFRGEHTPYRLLVSAMGTLPIGRGKRRMKLVQYGYMGWTADQTAEPSRLPGSGTFLYHGLHAVERAAREYLALAETTGVSVRTNQDRPVYRWVKLGDGTVKGYSTRGE